MEQNISTKQNNEFSVFDIANYFINLSLKNEIDDGVSEGITHLKLQKILYFAQAAYLSLNNKELFPDEIQAWKYGPVIESVYNEFKGFRNNTLELPENYKDNLDEDTKIFLKGIWELFSKYSANELINITHNHQPWKECYKEGENSVIPKNLLTKYYKNIFQFQDV